MDKKQRTPEEIAREFMEYLFIQSGFASSASAQHEKELAFQIVVAKAEAREQALDEAVYWIPTHLHLDDADKEKCLACMTLKNIRALKGGKP